MLKHLKQVNPSYDIKHITDDSFHTLGQILKAESFEKIFKFLSTTPMPLEGNSYVAHDETFFHQYEHLNAVDDIFGNMPVQYGYVNGFNQKLNSMEFHKSSEINVFLTEAVIMLAPFEALKHGKLNISDIRIYYVEPYTVLEFYPQTLHFSPCRVTDQGFKVGVILPYGTNMKFIQAHDQEDPLSSLLLKTNKWLIAHPEHQAMISNGAKVGIIGENIHIHY
jgi:hypothetical protein